MNLFFRFRPGTNFLFAGFVLLALTNSGLTRWGQNTPPPPEVKILLHSAHPPGNPPGEGMLTVRGNGLDKVEEIRFQPAAKDKKPTQIKLVKKEKVAPPANKTTARAGEWQIQMETRALPVENGFFEFLDKEKKVLTRFPWENSYRDYLPEKEPNNGLQEANAIPSGKWVQGTIGSAKDVDVFAWELPAGHSKVEIQGNRFAGFSLVDLFLFIHNEQGDLITEMAWTSKESLVLSLPKPGKYFFSFIDINDTDSIFHCYQFKLLPR